MPDNINYYIKCITEHGWVCSHLTFIKMEESRSNLLFTSLLTNSDSQTGRIMNPVSRSRLTLVACSYLARAYPSPSTSEDLGTLNTNRRRARKVHPPYPQ